MEKLDHDPSWLTVREAASRIRCGRRVIYQAVTSKKLKSMKVGLALRIHVDWFNAWLDAEATKAFVDDRPDETHLHLS
jgi:excisionase family DNA binding protein